MSLPFQVIETVNESCATRLKDWCERVSEATGATWRYVRINQTEFDTRRAKTLGDLVSAA